MNEIHENEIHESDLREIERFAINNRDYVANLKERIPIDSSILSDESKQKIITFIAGLLRQGWRPKA